MMQRKGEKLKSNKFVLQNAGIIDIRKSIWSKTSQSNLTESKKKELQKYGTTQQYKLLQKKEKVQSIQDVFLDRTKALTGNPQISEHCYNQLVKVMNQNKLRKSSDHQKLQAQYYDSREIRSVPQFMYFFDMIKTKNIQQISEEKKIFHDKILQIQEIQSENMSNFLLSQNTQLSPKGQLHSDRLFIKRPQTANAKKSLVSVSREPSSPQSQIESFQLNPVEFHNKQIKHRLVQSLHSEVSQPDNAQSTNAMIDQRLLNSKSITNSNHFSNLQISSNNSSQNLQLLRTKSANIRFSNYHKQQQQQAPSHPIASKSVADSNELQRLAQRPAIHTKHPQSKSTLTHSIEEMFDEINNFQEDVVQKLKSETDLVQGRPSRPKTAVYKKQFKSESHDENSDLNWFTLSSINKQRLTMRSADKRLVQLLENQYRPIQKIPKAPEDINATSGKVLNPNIVCTLVEGTIKRLMKQQESQEIRAAVTPHKEKDLQQKGANPAFLNQYFTPQSSMDILSTKAHSQQNTIQRFYGIKSSAEGMSLASLSSSPTNKKMGLIKKVFSPHPSQIQFPGAETGEMFNVVRQETENIDAVQSSSRIHQDDENIQVLRAEDLYAPFEQGPQTIDDGKNQEKISYQYHPAFEDEQVRHVDQRINSNIDYIDQNLRMQHTHINSSKNIAEQIDKEFLQHRSQVEKSHSIHGRCVNYQVFHMEYNEQKNLLLKKTNNNKSLVRNQNYVQHYL